MANRTVKDAQTIKGTNPQYLVEKIIRSRIYDCKYWKEECFALTSELVVDKAMELRYVGGVYAGNIKPTPFLCLTLKMLQIQPQKDIVIEFIRNEDFKYVRALGAYYMRLTGTSLDCYKYLEPLLNDYRKIRLRDRDGKYHLSHMDEFIDQLLREDRVTDIQLPRLQKRHVLEENNELDSRVSLLEIDDFDLDDEDEEEEDEDDEDFEEKKRIAEMLDKAKQSSKDERRDRPRRSRSRSRSRDRDRQDRKRRRSRSRDRENRPRQRSRSRSKSRERRPRRDEFGERIGKEERRKDKERKDRDRSEKDHKKDGKGGSKDSMSIEETNEMRASLGLPPLK